MVMILLIKGRTRSSLPGNQNLPTGPYKGMRNVSHVLSEIIFQSAILENQFITLISLHSLGFFEINISFIIINEKGKK